MPANPTNVDKRVVLSGDYHDQKATVDIYSNNAVAIYRGDQDEPKRVWLDNLEKQKLLEVLHG